MILFLGLDRDDPLTPPYYDRINVSGGDVDVTEYMVYTQVYFFYWLFLFLFFWGFYFIFDFPFFLFYFPFIIHFIDFLIFMYFVAPLPYISFFFLLFA